MIAYDTNILIYAFEGTSPWAAAAEQVVRLGEQDGAVLSVLAWQELITGAALRKDQSEERLVAALQVFGATRFVPVTASICRRAVGLTKRFGRGIFGYDAILLATALEHKATVFVTNDQVLLQLRLDGLEIRSL